jgi:hypothetical protein
MEMNSEKIKPDTCPMCENSENWLDTPHGLCDDCMSLMLACIRLDPRGTALEAGHYKNALNHYKVYAPEDECYEAYDYQDTY